MGGPESHWKNGGVGERSQNIQRAQLPCLLTPGEQEVALLGPGATLEGDPRQSRQRSLPSREDTRSPGKTPGLDHWLPTF